MQINSLSLCLNKEISHNPKWENVNTEILIEVSRVISKIKMLISWLDRNPFQGKMNMNNNEKFCSHFRSSIFSLQL
jgi:hypothetical protein